MFQKRLNNVVIDSKEKLKELGSKETLMILKGLDNDDICINTFYAFEGAIRRIRWHSLDKSTKIELKEFYKIIKAY
ncbi:MULTISPECIES: TfoX/Sxy family DNA transformation protein [Clostridium]|uniref:Competence protein TfoX n=1 Tax=Clostridium sporogenes TaxID=1509 RepID=A0A6B5A7I4_CLOSG|nr:TfoX/Sxy family DNA transformation protein [Clostridium sporogenes]AVP59586.1 competence protein TfoX [Clostridium botulinum]AKJ89305.1 hypothetical protein CLSPOx_06530 [Clostridium sporogenes]KOY65168.1 hypothetical protein AN649_15770 [Clostridium sporogenes]MBY7016760.1 TfoX/Sxy family DNA transformation protein [Clostridium sporogenes]MBY7066558.1 TfoX/Sxy family DNA transformation protein [Clostridium sporogenes]